MSFKWCSGLIMKDNLTVCYHELFNFLDLTKKFGYGLNELSLRSLYTRLLRCMARYMLENIATGLELKKFDTSDLSRQVTLIGSCYMYMLDIKRNDAISIQFENRNNKKENNSLTAI